MLTLKNHGEGTCAVPFNAGFVTIGGGKKGGDPFFGNVDRCTNHNCHPFSVFVPGTILKANTWVLFPTWPHLELTTPAPVSSPAAGSR